MAADQPEASEQVPSEGEVSISPDGQDVLPGDGASEGSSTFGDSQSRKPIDWESRAREFQGAKDRLEAKVKDVLPLVEQYGGDGIQNLLATFERVLQHPDLGVDVKSYIADPNSYRRKPAAVEDDDMDDLDSKPWKNEVEEIRSMLGQVTELAQGLQRNQGMSSIESYSKKFQDSYPMTDEEKTRFVEKMEGKFGSMNGPGSAQLIQNMTYEQYTHMALPAIEEFRSDIEARRLTDKRRDINRKATDAPGAATHGVEAPASIPVPKSLREVQARARAAMRKGMELE
jgi:hypothetical protein